MTSKEKLKNICNYFEQKSNSYPILQLPIIEMVSEDDEYLLAEKKRQNRERAIDITLGEKDESDWSKKDIIEPSTWGQNISDKLESDRVVISPKIMTLNLNISNLKTHDEVYDYVIDFIDKNTNVAKKLQNGGNSMQFNLKISGGNYPEYEKFESDLRKIITKVNLCSSVVIIEGRMGPPKTIIVGKANWIYFKEIELRYGGINSLKFIYDDKIDPNKVVVLRNSVSGSDPGIILIENNGIDFYIKESSRWDRQFCWFWIN
jgi:hypothetical protein